MGDVYKESSWEGPEKFAKPKSTENEKFATYESPEQEKCRKNLEQSVQIEGSYVVDFGDARYKATLSSYGDNVILCASDNQTDVISILPVSRLPAFIKLLECVNKEAELERAARERPL